jgi:hypothetical protein
VNPLEASWNKNAVAYIWASSVAVELLNRPTALTAGLVEAGAARGSPIPHNLSWGISWAASPCQGNARVSGTTHGDHDRITIPGGTAVRERDMASTP